MKRFSIFTFLLLLTTQIFSAPPVASGSAISIVAGPTTITQPGNYRLANDIFGTITIAANDVTLDLENKRINDVFNGIEVGAFRNVNVNSI